MGSPADCRFLESHEWHRLDGEVVTVGVSRFAVDELTDVTFVQLPAVGKHFAAGQPIGEIESVKTTSELYTGVGGTVAEVNRQAIDNPSIINEDPYGKGWLVKIKPANPADLNTLIDAGEYDRRYPSH